MLNTIVVASFLATCPLAPWSAPTGGSTLENVSLDLGSETQWILLDNARSRAVISLPDANRLAVISTVTYEVLSEPFVGQSPRGLALSIDGDQLFVALGTSGSVAVIDAETYTVDRTINATALLGDARTWDVSEAQPGFLYVSANPGSNGLAWIVQVDLENGDAQQRVASNRIIRAAPEFAESPDHQSLYVGESIFSPNSLYKLDLSQADAPIILEDDHGAISGARDMAVSPDGSEIVLASGQVLSTETFISRGSIGSGEPAFDPTENGQFIWRIGASGSFRRFDYDTLLEVDSIDSTCAFGTGLFSTATSFVVRPGGLGYLGLESTGVCGVSVVGAPFVQVAQLTPNLAQWNAPSTTVEVQGSFFAQADILQVQLNGVPVQATVLEDDRLSLIVPAGTPGPVDLSIENTTGTTTVPGAFLRTPTLVGDRVTADLGDFYELTLDQAPFSGVVLFAGTPGDALELSPIGGALGVDLTASPFVIANLLWPTNQLKIGFDLPDDPALAGLELRFQALVGTPGSPDAAFSNPADLLLGVAP